MTALLLVFIWHLESLDGDEIQWDPKKLKLLAASGIARMLSAVFGQSSSSLTPSRLHGTDTHYLYIAIYVCFYYI